MLLDLSKITDLSDNIYKKFLEDRVILFNGEVSSYFFETCAMMIRYFNMEDEKNDVPVEERKPIQLYIDSYGGSVYDGFSIVNSIVTSKTPVHGHCSGYAMSMGVAIFAACHKRYCYPYTSFMIHDISTSVSGKNEEIERITAENKRLQKMYDSIIINNTSITQAELNKIKRKVADFFFGAEYALEKGLVHEVIQ